MAASETQRSGSLIYSLYMMGNTMPLADQVYILQSNVIKEVASQGSCVILGRCGDYVLRDRPNVLRTFVFAPIDIRVANAKVRPDAKDMPDRLWETLWPSMTAPAQAITTTILKTAGAKRKTMIFA